MSYTHHQTPSAFQTGDRVELRPDLGISIRRGALRGNVVSTTAHFVLVRLDREPGSFHAYAPSDLRIIGVA